MHNPEHAAREFADKLVARSRHATFLLGAGASCAAGLPDLSGLKQAVADRLEPDAFKALADIWPRGNIEQVLSRLRLLSEALSDGKDKLNGLTAGDADAFDRMICSKIAEHITSVAVSTDTHERFARWAASSRYDLPLEVFTTNYDLLIETGLELTATPYFDGFVGSYQATFRADLVDDNRSPSSLHPPARWVRVWKLHGSVSWAKVGEGAASRIVRSADSYRLKPESILAIYPSLQKYEESRRVPFVVLGDRFRRSLEVSETLCVVVGYSFGDQHLNQLLFDSAAVHSASEIVALFYSAIPESVVVRALNIPNLTLLGPREAVIGGVRANWETPDQASPFWKDGRFTLGDFAALSHFLLINARSVPLTSPTTHGGGE